MRFILHTYGCQMNVRDSESVSALLQAAGHTPADTEDEADLIVVNSCSVRGKAEDKALGKLGLLCATKRERPGRIVGLMGCMAQRLGSDIFKRVPALDFSVGTRRCGAIPRMAARVLAGETGICEISSPDEIPDAPDAHSDLGFSAFVTVLLGCNRRCAYCIVPDVRGPEYSRPAREILAEIAALALHGVREITLLGQSVMNYGRTNTVWDAADASSPGGYAEPFARLLEAVAAIPRISRIRFTSGHPSGVTDQLVRAVASLPQICHHLHLPVQSGSDRILGLMRRGYTRADYLAAVRRLRTAMPDFALTSDVIVGFPGETDADVQTLMDFAAEARLDALGVFAYSDEEGTEGVGMDGHLPQEVIDERFEQVSELANDLVDQRALERVGERVRVLVESIEDGVAVGRAEHQGPEVDGTTSFAHGAHHRVGDLVWGRVIGTEGVDLMAREEAPA